MPGELEGELHRRRTVFRAENQMVMQGKVSPGHSPSFSRSCRSAIRSISHSGGFARPVVSLAALAAPPANFSRAFGSKTRSLVTVTGDSDSTQFMAEFQGD